NNIFMGDDLILTSEKVKFMIFAEDIRYKVKEIHIISNKGKLIKNISDINLNNIKYIYEHKHEKDETWYVIKIIQESGKIAFTSPIFITENLE
ncbi:MAG: histidinol phosphatase, partial [Clostridium sp.]